ncbi:hypothetical protein HDE_09555 [Halotydeus destructor]|nr:hypothetical protein HDE_09555 [Halotydeus destructor]
MGVGYLSRNGEYTGFLGELMTNRSDVALFGTVLSSFNFTGVVPGNVGSGLTLKVHSKIAAEISEPLDVLSSIEQLPSEFTIFFFVMVHVVAGGFIIVGPTNLTYYLRTSWHCVRCFVSQGDWNVESAAQRIQWLHFNIFAFVAVVGYVLNLMSTDAFLVKQTRRIETLEDIFDPHFERVRFFIMKNDPFFNYMHQAKKNSVMGKLYKKMDDKSDCSKLSTCSFFEVDGGLGSASQLEMFNLVKNVSREGGAANFFTNEVIDKLSLPTLCRFDPDMVSLLYTAPYVFAEDIMVNLVRADIDKHVDSYLRYITSNMLEFDLLWKSGAENIHDLLDPVYTNGRDLDYFHCVARNPPESGDTSIVAGILAFKRLTALSTYMVVVAALGLFVESVIFSRKRKQRRRRRPKKINYSLET